MNAVLYISRNGLLEPLGQSQILPYLRKIGRNYKVILITYEKSEDWADTKGVANAFEICKKNNIFWKPKRFRPRMFQSTSGVTFMCDMIFTAAREVWKNDCKLVHARSYIPCIAALAVNRSLGTPFVFDMRALLPEELISSGRLKKDGLPEKFLRYSERLCLANSSVVVSLTNAAAAHLRLIYPKEVKNKKIAVIPTCVDLDKFSFTGSRIASKKKVYGCIGTLLSGWFKVDWLSSWIETVLSNDPDASFEILTRENREQVRRKLDPYNQFNEQLVIASKSAAEMPCALTRHSSSAMFFSAGLAKLGSSPTRMGEILATGLPIVTNSGVGDVRQIIERYNVGVIVETNSTHDMRAAYHSLKKLEQEPDLAARCRSAAESIFSLQSGVDEYLKIYKSILS